MVKTDDSSIDAEQQRAVHNAARRALDRASAWGVFPTPTSDILSAAKLRVAPTSAFDPRRILAYIAGKAERSASALKSAISKVLGIYDAGESVIHIDDTVHSSKQNFLKLHEAGHHEMPTHRKLFRLFQDCEKHLDPDIADAFEREANNFARYVLFQGDTFRNVAADHPLEIKSVLKIAPNFGASVYASCREYARTHRRACAVYILEKVTFCAETGARADVRRIEVSREYERQFGRPAELAITLRHSLGKVLPIGRKMTRATPVSVTDRNGYARECLAEAFDTTFNVIVLVYPVQAFGTRLKAS
ncbi:ImmA/IrrE family metallo-endopeptidase [Mesorhizobium sp. B2-5-9]|uniref:ImmA/IrrE family metallo-endopeptidase n=1 Tax=unclassified Mesorhizobium TaxID=325217 RepID=UPI00112615A5|nr:MULTISPECIES: ImmA/IrrE family metallo-endopeptidase [unclassified Mesorhizobium]TPJ35912.1 ImmA/IrrE family metallo-endopeptidase [Mesorhizobium sp. B2-6-5]TPK23954.1 ImmA/IrrE family metallo-endopeptidase [Mesorhizobium sp. B2-5-9]TPK24018.1 ImmA/IrrE family metallo-endopeptidase [Mesorhizobium sp. B2-5-9]